MLRCAIRSVQAAVSIAKPVPIAPLGFSRLLQIFFALACLVRPVGAQEEVLDQRLILSVVPEYGVSRGHTPLSLAVSLSWLAPELIEGDLQLDWFVDTTRLGRYVIPDLALADSRLNLSVMLPPVTLSSDQAVCSVEGRFITKQAAYDLEEHDIALQPDWRRVLLVGLCRDPQPVVANQIDMLKNQQHLALPRSFDLVPFFEGRFTKRELFVDYSEVAIDDVPTDPLRMTAFDLFVIPGESLAKLKAAQLDSLEDWVSAGGSLCVIVDASIPDSHVAWLNRLAGRDRATAVYLKDAEGHVISTDSTTESIQQISVNLGRFVVALRQPQIDSDQWRQTVLFLWKARKDHRSQSLQGLHWTMPASTAIDDRRGGSSRMYEALLESGNYVDLQPKRIWSTSALTELLLPESVRGLPLGTVCLILVLFLLAIAPADYLLLGWLKRRRWTWVLFPTLSILFTGFTMWMARQHLGQSSYDRTITVIDIGDDGRAVRASQFQMLYTAANRHIVSEQQHALMVPLDPDITGPFQLQYGTGELDLYEQPWTFQGRVPTRYSVQRDVQQWSPRMARLTQLGPLEDAQMAEALSRIDWDRFQLSHRQEQLSIGPDHYLTITPDETQRWGPLPKTIPQELILIADQITRRHSEGFFSVVSQLSPTAGGNWEDLALLDPSDPDQEVQIVISSPGEGQYVITRRFVVNRQRQLGQ